MKVFEIAGPVFSGPSGDFAPTTPDKELANMAPEEELTLLKMLYYLKMVTKQLEI